jgi:NADPH-dependent ferric siderophore reductase
MLKAQCDLPISDAEWLLTLFCDHFTEHGEVHRRGSVGRVIIPYGRFWAHALDDKVVFRVQTNDETYLTYLKMGVVHHLKEFLGDEAPLVRWAGDGKAGGAPPFWRELRVVTAFDVTPSMRRVVFSGNDLGRFAVGGFHVRLFFPLPGRPLRGPVLGQDGCPIWPQGADALTARVYTIREIDPATGEMAIDILRHDGDATPGSSFAVNAKAGDVVGLAGPSGDIHPPPASHIYFFGDETAIPAIDRILRQLPANVRASATIEVSSPAERQPLTSAARLDVTWLLRGEDGCTLARAAEELTHERLGKDGYVWAGCEFSDFKAIRRHCRRTLKLDRQRHSVAAYWRKGSVCE